MFMYCGDGLSLFSVIDLNEAEFIHGNDRRKCKSYHKIQCACAQMKSGFANFKSNLASFNTFMHEKHSV